jgi:putative colanic acid biosynthesis acetyltransferase WcaF
LLAHPVRLAAWRLQVGQACWLAEDAWLDNLAPISLGDRVCLSQGTYLCTGNHDFRSPGFDLRLGPITIGPDAWIAAPRAVLAPGTVIGAGAVVALGAVVSGAVPPGAIVRGNPAVVVGER